MQILRLIEILPTQFVLLNIQSYWMHDDLIIVDTYSSNFWVNLLRKFFTVYYSDLSAWKLYFNACAWSKSAFTFFHHTNYTSRTNNL